VGISQVVTAIQSLLIFRKRVLECFWRLFIILRSIHLQTWHNSKSSWAQKVSFWLSPVVFRPRWISSQPKWTKRNDTNLTASLNEFRVCFVTLPVPFLAAWAMKIAIIFLIAFGGFFSHSLELLQFFTAAAMFAHKSTKLLEHLVPWNEENKQKKVIWQVLRGCCSCQSLKSLVTLRNVVRNH
jgi:hypothetical protein